MVREYPAGSSRDDARWPMFWATKEGSCPFIKPSHTTISTRDPAKQTSQVPITTTATTTRPRVLRESKVGNRQRQGQGHGVEQPASGIVNSSNAFSAIRSTTTCGSNLTSAAVAGMTTGIVTRQVRGLETRLTPVTANANANATAEGVGMPPPTKRRRLEVLREKVVKKKEKREGYCENCKDRYDDYTEVLTFFNRKLIIAYGVKKA